MAIVLFSIALALVVYVLFGYPLLLRLISRRRERPVQKQERYRTVSVLLPVHNGEAHLKRKLESLFNLDYPKDLMEIVIVSDGSTDRTPAIAAAYAGRGVHLIELPRSGKATALNHAMKAATGEILLFTDVRQRLERDSLRHLIACFSDPAVGVVSGELIIAAGENLEQVTVGLYWKYEAWIRKQLSKMDSILGATGCLYAMRHDLASPLPPSTLLDDVYEPLVAFFRGYRVILEEKAHAIDFPTALKTEFFRKVRTQSGMYQILVAWPALLTSENRMRFHFLSHKFGRLLLPFALIVMAVCTPWLPEPVRIIAVVGQGLFYLAALLDFIVPDGWPGKRILSIARTFVTLVLAALLAPFALFTGKRLWKPTEVSAKQTS